MYESYEQFEQENFGAGSEIGTSYIEDYENLFGKKFKQGLKNLLNKVGDGLKNAGETALFVPLLPFKSGMKKKLKSKGISTGNSMREITESFYNNVVKGSNYEDYESENFLPFALGAGAAAGGAAGVSSGASGGGGGEPLTIVALINAVLNFIVNITKKPQSKEDKELAEALNDSANKFTEKSDTEIVKEERKFNIASLGAGAGKGAGKKVGDKGTTKDVQVTVGNGTITILVIAALILLMSSES